MSYRLRLQTDLREEHLDPSETKKGSRGILGTVSTEHHKITRSGDLVQLPGLHDGLHDSTLNLASGTLATSAGRDQNYALQDLIGTETWSSPNVHYQTDRVWAPPLFELERLMARSLDQLDLIDVSDPYHDAAVPVEYIAAVRSTLVEFLARYRDSVAQSRLKKPTIERHFQIAQRTGESPEDLQRLYGGQLYQTLQETFNPRKQRASKKK